MEHALVEAEDDVPHAHPYVGCDHKGRVGEDVADSAADEREHGAEAAHGGQLAAHQGPLGDADEERRRRAEDDKGLDVCELQRLDVGIDAGEEGERDWEEGPHLCGLNLVDVNEAEHAHDFDRHPRARDLRQQHEGWRREIVHSQLIDHEPDSQMPAHVGLHVRVQPFARCLCAVRTLDSLRGRMHAE